MAAVSMSLGATSLEQSHPPQDDPFAAIREAALEEDGAAEGLLVILSALRETIGECRVTPSATAGKATAEPSASEYLAAIIPALQGTDQSHTPQLLSLLVAVMPHAHRSLLRQKFPAVAAVFMALLKENGLEAEDTEATAVASSANVLQRVLICTGHLLAAQEPSSAVWNSPGVLRAFHSLLHFFADHRSKVRRAAQEAVVAVLATQRSGSVSGGIGGTNKTMSSKGPAALTMEFCRVVVNSCTSQDVTRALHLLQFMRLGVPLFPPNQAASLCELSLRLLPLGSPALTAAVMQMLSAVVQSPRPCMTAPLLAKLTEELLTLQPSRSAGAGAVSFAPLVASCLVRLQGMDSEASSKLLAQAVLALTDYCESSSTTVHKSSCGALNLMFQACVDQSMVTQMAGSLGRGHAASGPLADTLSALESLLQYRFQRSWPQSLPLLGRLFLHLRGASYPLLVNVLRGLGELHDALTSVPSAALPGVTSALNEAVSFAIQGMGTERVLGVLPLAPTGATPVAEGGLAEARAWLLPLLTEHTGAAPSRLAFFQSYVLTTAKACDGAAKSGRLTANEARTQRFRVVQLWGLLPGFCARPSDVASTFGNLAPTLANAMQDVNYPGILPVVCAGLQALVAGVKSRCGAEVGGGDAAAKADLEKLSHTTTRFLPKLFALVDPGGDGVVAAGAETGPDASAAMMAANERTAAVCGAAAALATVAPPAFLSTLFKKLLQKLIESTTVGGADAAGTERAEEKAPALKRAQVLLELASGLAPSLDQEATSLLYRSTKPLVLDDSSPQLQKRAYKVLLALCAHRADFMSSPENLPNVLELFTSSLLSCHVSARVMRLQCLSRLAASFTPEKDVQAKFLPAATLEVVLCTKDSNGRTRELAYNVLVLLAVARGNPADTARTVVGGLAASTPHARSAAVLALGYLQLEFGHFRSERWDARVADMVPELTATMLLLLKEPSREVVKAVLGWLRVAVGGADREVLRPMIADIVVGVMSGTTPRHKDHFRAKIRIVLSKLCRKFGFEEIKALMPEQDKKLVAHMQTTAERELKAKKTRLAGGRGGGDDGGRGGSANPGEGKITKAVRTFDTIMEGSDADDSDSEDEGPNTTSTVKSMPAKGGARRGAAKGADMMVRERGEDGTSVVDLLDASMVRNMRVSSTKRGGMKKGGSGGGGFFSSDDSGSDDSDDDDDGPELGLRDGKFVIPGGSDEDESDDDGGGGGRKKKRSRNNGDDSDDDDDDDRVVDTGKNDSGFVHMAGQKSRAAADDSSSQGAMGRSVPGVRGSGAGRGGGVAGKRQKVGAVRGTATGAEFRSKKAGGDVKRKGATLEPYAYIPLDGRTLTGKKAGDTALKQYGAVVGTVRGAKKGRQQRRRGHK
ncbi:conserved unknown protein [Ectocarpus siliculosus]|uniref:Uncharacterized protein n=1 Tax=Ectocarpus siliculosus TaxID=2880 RepID=D7FLE4_ECTSI|nr:conserved unknown protein [Ectocarpus siliculosus]|eukprot:CBJ29712.1 conserved unknown protein [Ectocarpus siliculosus]